MSDTLADPAQPKWTPGPWETFPSEMPGIDAPPAGKSIIIFGEGDDDCGIRGRTPEEAQANARLIAAAPDLYAALAAMCREFTYGNPDQREAISRARDALDKARGEP